VTTLLVCSDICLYREGLAQVLAREPGLEVAGTAADSERTVELAAELRPDIVLLDASLPDSETLIRALDARGMRVLALAVPEREDELVELAEAGVAGFVTRDEDYDDLLHAIALTARGETACSPLAAAVLMRRVTKLAAAMPRAGDRSPLTRREREVVVLLDEGLSNKEIARRLHIELPTVKNHVHRILEKLEASGRAEAAERARMQGVL
jgi:DNA-binding NarL/FixJ family response regulator